MCGIVERWKSNILRGVVMGLGYTRKELGKMHKQFYEEHLKKNDDNEAFQRAIMSMVKATLDIIDANNRKVEQDLHEHAKKHTP